MLPDDAIVVNETITHRLELHQRLDGCGPGGFFEASYGGLGVGLGLALGVKYAHPERTVVCTIGDGAFHYNPVVGSLRRRAGARPAASWWCCSTMRATCSQKSDVVNYYPKGAAVQTGKVIGTRDRAARPTTRCSPRLRRLGEQVDRPGDVRAALQRGLEAVARGGSRSSTWCWRRWAAAEQHAVYQDHTPLQIAGQSRSRAPSSRAACATPGWKFRQHVDRMAAYGVPQARRALLAGFALQFVGRDPGRLDYQRVLAAWLLVAFTLFASLIFHRWWLVQDALLRHLHIGNLLVNLGVVGGLLLVERLSEHQAELRHGDEQRRDQRHDDDEREGAGEDLVQGDALVVERRLDDVDRRCPKGGVSRPISMATTAY